MFFNINRLYNKILIIIAVQTITMLEYNSFIDVCFFRIMTTQLNFLSVSVFHLLSLCSCLSHIHALSLSLCSFSLPSFAFSPPLSLSVCNYSNAPLCLCADSLICIFFLISQYFYICHTQPPMAFRKTDRQAELMMQTVIWCWHSQNIVYPSWSLPE